MNAAEVLRRLWKEKHEWKSYDDTPEVRWTLRGINLCIDHVKAIAKEQADNERLRKPRIARWLARDLYHAVEVSLGYMRRADRITAIKVLEKIKAEVQTIEVNR